MARIRTIKPEFWGDEKLAPCSPITRLVFLGLISMADDAGRVVDNVKVIDAFIFPETSETSRGSLGELSAMRRIRRGKTASGQRIIEIANWSAHQKIEKANLKAAFPEIVEEEEVTDIPRLVGETSGNDRGDVGEESSNHTNDLRPTTVIPTTNDPLPKRAKKPRASAPVENEVAVLGDWWTETFGAIEYAPLGRWSKPIRARYSLAQIQAAATVYNSDEEGPRGFRSPQHFFQTFVKWHQLAQTPVVQDGELTERGRKIMGAA